jgi:hypothetical protein
MQNHINAIPHQTRAFILADPIPKGFIVMQKRINYALKEGFLFTREPLL